MEVHSFLTSKHDFFNVLHKSTQTVTWALKFVTFIQALFGIFVIQQLNQNRLNINLQDT